MQRLINLTIVTLMTTLISNAQTPDERVSISGSIASDTKISQNTIANLLNASDKALINKELLSENSFFIFENGLRTMLFSRTDVNPENR